MIRSVGPKILGSIRVYKWVLEELGGEGELGIFTLNRHPYNQILIAFYILHLFELIFIGGGGAKPQMGGHLYKTLKLPALGGTLVTEDAPWDISDFHKIRKPCHVYLRPDVIGFKTFHRRQWCHRQKARLFFNLILLNITYENIWFLREIWKACNWQTLGEPF